MKRLTNGLIAIGMAFSAIAATPTITGVTAQQRYPWNGKVDISYTVTGDIAAEAKERGLLTSLKVTATDRDANTTYTATALSGDRSLAAGTHSIVWDMDAQGLSFKSSNVVFSVACEATPALYCVIDLSAGANASSYPVTYLAAPPSGGFNVDTYKTTKLVLRRISKGTNSAGGAIANDMWVGIFEITKSQWLRVDSRDDVLIYGDLHGESRPADAVPIERIQKDFLPAIRNRTGIPGFCLPTEAEWEYACRAGTTTKYNNGRDDENGLKLVGRYDGNRAPGWAGPNHYHAIVGSYVPNAWGLYDICMGM